MNDEQREAIFYVFRGAGATFRDAHGGVDRVAEILATPKAEDERHPRDAALIHLLDAIHGGRFIPDGPGSAGFCNSLVEAGEAALKKAK